MYNKNHILTSEGYFPVNEKINARVKTYGIDKWNSANIILSNKRLLSIEFSNGMIVNVPPHHRVYNEDLELLEINKLCVDDKIYKFIMPVVDVDRKKDEHSYTNGYYEGWKNRFISTTTSVTDVKIQAVNDMIYIYIPIDKKILSTKIKVVGRYIRKENIFIGMLKTTYKGVPINGSVYNKIEWLAGLIDCIGYVHFKKYETRYIKLKINNREFATQVLLLCHLLGLSPNLEKIISAQRKIKGMSSRVMKHYEIVFKSDDVNSLMMDYRLQYLILKYDKSEFNADMVMDDYLVVKSITSIENESSYDLTCSIDYTINGLTFRS